MPLIMCTKFKINQIILTLFSGVWDKNPTPVAEKVVKVHVPNFGGCQGRRTGVGVTTVFNSLILGGWVTKVVKNGDKK